MRYFTDKIASIFFQRAITPKRGIILSRKKIHVSYFFMRNPYKKFQNISIYGSKVMLCIKKHDERTDGWMNNPEAICPSNFFEVGGIKMFQYLGLILFLGLFFFFRGKTSDDLIQMYGNR